MVAYPDGLNYLPLLSQTPPGSGRSRSHSSFRGSIQLKQQKLTLACFNGNYEGDSSMFGHQSVSSRMDLIETDSETEYKNELEKYEATPPETYRTAMEQQMRRLLKHYKERLLTPQRLARVAAFTERIYYRKLCDLLRLTRTLLLWLLRLLLLSVVRVGSWSYGLWRSRSLLRNSARRMLWCMTLAKCGDLSLFALILVATPLLFAVALVGFVLSLYCLLKEWVSRSTAFIRLHVF